MYRKPFFVIYKLVIITKKKTWCVNSIQANLEKENQFVKNSTFMAKVDCSLK